MILLVVHHHQEIMTLQPATRNQLLNMTTLQIEWAEIIMADITEIKIVVATDVIKEEADLVQEIVTLAEDHLEVDLEAETNIVKLVAVAAPADTAATEVEAKVNINVVVEISILLKHNQVQDTEKILVADVVDRAVAECALIHFTSINPTFLILKFFS